MAKSNTHSLITLPLLSLLLILTTPFSSSARPLNNHFFTFTAGAAIEPTFNLALPTDNNIDGAAALKETGHVTLCDMALTSERRFRATPRLVGKYGPLVLNMLPKGKVPPSGPSRGTNNLNN